MIVLDEVHYLGDPSRGSVWEEVIINCPKHIQLCAMSATVANADALGGWIDEVLSCSPLTACEHLRCLQGSAAQTQCGRVIVEYRVVPVCHMESVRRQHMM